jgi:hypothetical protein
MKGCVKEMIIVMLLIMWSGVVSESFAATLTWTNATGNGKASNEGNWSAGVVPQDGDKINFDNTSIDNCIWDLTVTLANMVVSAEYSGTVTISMPATLTLDKTIAWTGGGTDNYASNPANWSDNAVPEDGDKIVFNDASSKNCTWDINVLPALLSISSAYTGTVTLDEYLSINGNLTVAGGVLNLQDNDLFVYGYLLIGANGGSFGPGSSTVILSGINQTIYGNTTFYILIKTVTVADNLYFESGSTQSIAHSLTLEGIENNLLSLRSAVDGEFWYIDPRGARNISFASIKDMKNINFVNIVPLNSVDEGHNDDVSFGGSECACFDNGFMLARVLCIKGRGIC